jgi:hypothetical protein
MRPTYYLIPEKYKPAWHRLLKRFSLLRYARNTVVALVGAIHFTVFWLLFPVWVLLMYAIIFGEVLYRRYEDLRRLLAVKSRDP